MAEFFAGGHLRFIDNEWRDDDGNIVHITEVKHAKWAHLGGDEWCCTNCGKVITTEGSWEKPTEKYCNNCGAHIDEIKVKERF